MPFILKIERTLYPVRYLSGSGKKFIVEDKQGLNWALEAPSGTEDVLFSISESKETCEIDPLIGQKRVLVSLEQFNIANYLITYFYISDRAVLLHKDLSQEESLISPEAPDRSQKSSCV